jgi:uncharacterized protein
MKFWDTSAIVALLVDEPRQRAVRDKLERDAAMTVWWGTRVECVSALARRERERSVDPASAQRAFVQLSKLADQWQEVLPTQPLRNLAERIVRVHVLRAADALQLAAALTAALGDPSAVEFVCLDERLNEAAAREGFAFS